MGGCGPPPNTCAVYVGPFPPLERKRECDILSLEGSHQLSPAPAQPSQNIPFILQVLPFGYFFFLVRLPASNNQAGSSLSSSFLIASFC